MAKLLQKQEKFCIHYAENGNATAAYKHAYKTENMRPATINRNASALLKNSKIATRLQELNKRAVSAAVMSKQEALELLSVKARVRITDVCDFSQELVGNNEDGDPVYQTVWTMKDSKDIAPEVLACIKSVTVTKTGPKIELYDANASAKLLADMLGWNAAIESKVTGEMTVNNLISEISAQNASNRAVLPKHSK
tara:strand:- start:634 stop:1218 length:585 start_codon:yes stop_codon:yes gene_type:complete